MDKDLTQSQIDRQSILNNGLCTLKGKDLDEAISNHFVTAKNDGHKVVNLTVSTFKTALNFSMLLKTSEKARDKTERNLWKAI